MLQLFATGVVDTGDKFNAGVVDTDGNCRWHPDTSARIYRASFGHENARFRENMPKTLVFNSIRTQRRRFQLVLDEIRLVGSF